jgi:hypothetical protein
MKKRLIIIGIVALLVCVGLSGCNQISNPLTTDKTLPRGIKVTGDTGQIEIVNHQMVKRKYLQIASTSDKFSDYKDTFREEVPYELNISDINSNLSKRKSICDSYFTKNYWTVWNNNYTGYTSHLGLVYHVDGYSSDNTVTSLIVTGTAKNIGTEFLNTPYIIVNFYNANGAWLASQTANKNNVPSGYTWNFRVDYSGEFRNDVSYISFEVKAKPYG